MRAVVQRVKRASVTVDGDVVASIERGLCVLIGISANDTQADCDYILRRLLKLKVWDAPDSRPWKQNIADIDGDILLVSQFTLFAELKNCALPTFHRSMAPEPARKFYSDFVEQMRSAYRPDKIKDGVFGALMDVELVNDGPVTLLLDSQKSDSKQT